MRPGLLTLGFPSEEKIRDLDVDETQVLVACASVSVCVYIDHRSKSRSVRAAVAI